MPVGSRVLAPLIGRLLVALAVVALLSPALIAPVVRADPPASPAAAPAPTGLSDFGACLTGRGRGSMIILIDQSGSLRSSDPDKARVTAAQYLVRRLTAFTRSTGISLDVRVAGFSADYAAAGQWTALNDDALDSINASIAAVGQDIKDYDTDYWTALEGARQDLADHDPGGCSAIAWLSDGAFDLDVRDTPAAAKQFGENKPYARGADLTDESGVGRAEQAGQQDLCRPTGLADQLRSSGITLLGIGLSKGQADFTLMRRITQGGGQGAAAAGLEPCGDVGAPAGSFYPVSDIDSLLLAFDTISAPGSTVISRSSRICQGSVCQEGETSFVLDGSLEEVHILASSDVDGLTAYLYAPGATEPVVLPASRSGAQTDQGVHSEWITARTLQIDLVAGDLSAWDGHWRLAFADTSSSSADHEVHINLHLSSPLTLSWQNLADAELRQGQTVDDARIVLLDHAGGHDVDPARITGSIAYSVTLTDSQGAQHTLLDSTDPARLAGPVSLTLGRDIAPGAATLTTSVTVTTASIREGDRTIDGTTLAPTLASVPVTVNPPEDFPSLGDAVDFGRVEESTTASASLPVTGPGCVWVGADATALTGAPAEAGTIAVSAQASDAASCLTAAKGQSAQLPLTLMVAEHANGAVTGTIAVTVAPLDSPDRAQVIEVPFKADMRRPLDVGTAWTAFVLALLAGVGIPVGLLYLSRFLAARIPAGPLVTAVKAVDVPRPGVVGSFSVAPQDLRTRTVFKPVRELDVDGYRLRVAVGVSLTALPQVRLVAPEVASVSGADPGSREGRAVLPLAVRGNWVAVLDQSDSSRRATLIILAASADQDVINRIVAEAARKLGTAVASVADDASDSPDRKDENGTKTDPFEPPASPFGSSASPSGSSTGNSPFGSSTSPFGSSTGPFGGSGERPH